MAKLGPAAGLCFVDTDSDSPKRPLIPAFSPHAGRRSAPSERPQL